MYSGKYADLGSKGSYLIKRSAVNTLALVKPVSYNLLLELVDALVYHSALLGIFGVESLMNSVLDGLEPCFSDVLVVGVKSYLYILGGHSFNRLEQAVVDLHRLKLKLGLADFSLDGVDKLNHALNFLVTGFDSCKHSLVVDLVGSGFYHYNLFHGSGNGEVEVIIGSLLQGGVEDDFAVDKTYADSGNRTCPRNIRDGYCDRCCKHTRDFGRTVGVNSHNGHNNANVVAHVLGEQGADGSVNHS